MGRKGGKGSIDDVLKCSEQGFRKVTIQDGTINILTTIPALLQAYIIMHSAVLPLNLELFNAAEGTKPQASLAKTFSITLLSSYQHILPLLGDLCVLSFVSFHACMKSARSCLMCALIIIKLPLCDKYSEN